MNNDMFFKGHCNDGRLLQLIPDSVFKGVSLRAPRAGSGFKERTKELIIFIKNISPILIG